MFARFVYECILTVTQIRMHKNVCLKLDITEKIESKQNKIGWHNFEICILLAAHFKKQKMENKCGISIEIDKMKMSNDVLYIYIISIHYIINKRMPDVSDKF